MTDLLTRLATEEGSRELSDECLLAVGWTNEGRNWFSPDGSWVCKEYGDPRPDPTRSLDDCIRWMVPEGANGKKLCTILEMYADGTGNCCIIPRNARSRDDYIWSKTARTPVAALCTASLKAREKTDG